MINGDTWAGLALPLIAAGLLVVAARPGSQPNFARVTREGGTAFLSERLMQRGYAWVDWLAARAVKIGISADAVSWLSLALGLAAGVLAALGWLGGAAWALALSGLGDGVDGAIARRQDTTSKAGAVLDSALDRYGEFFFFGGQPAPGDAGAPRRVHGHVFHGEGRGPANHPAPRVDETTGTDGLAHRRRGPRCNGLSPAPILLGVVGLIAVFAHASALRRHRALSAGADGRHE
jgi:hypothetical protein